MMENMMENMVEDMMEDTREREKLVTLLMVYLLMGGVNYRTFRKWSGSRRKK